VHYQNSPIIEADENSQVNGSVVSISVRLCTTVKHFSMIENAITTGLIPKIIDLNDRVYKRIITGSCKSHKTMSSPSPAFLCCVLYVSIIF